MGSAKKPVGLRSNIGWTCFISALFLYSFGSSGYFIYSAVQSSRGFIADKPYDDALHYENKIQRLRESKALGWTLDIVSRSRQLAFHLSDASGSPIEDAEVQFRALYPANAPYDTTGKFQKSTKPGVYELTTPLPAPGIWILQIQTTSPRPYFYEKTLHLF